MKIVTLLGSPRKNGNTSTLLNQFEDALAPDCQINRTNICEITVNGCKGCQACQSDKNEKGCIQKDDANSVFQSMIEADAILYASPIYSWDFTAQMKALIDRHFSMVTGFQSGVLHSKLAGKKVGLLVSCMGVIENNADLIQEAFKRLCQFTQCDIVGSAIIPQCTTPDAFDETHFQKVRELAENFRKG